MVIDLLLQFRGMTVTKGSTGYTCGDTLEATITKLCVFIEQIYYTKQTTLWCWKCHITGLTDPCQTGVAILYKMVLKTGGGGERERERDFEDGPDAYIILTGTWWHWLIYVEATSLQELGNFQGKWFSGSAVLMHTFVMVTVDKPNHRSTQHHGNPATFRSRIQHIYSCFLGIRFWHTVNWSIQFFPRYDILGFEAET